MGIWDTISSDISGAGNWLWGNVLSPVGSYAAQGFSGVQTPPWLMPSPSAGTPGGVPGAAPNMVPALEASPDAIQATAIENAVKQATQPGAATDLASAQRLATQQYNAPPPLVDPAAGGQNFMAKILQSVINNPTQIANLLQAFQRYGLSQNVLDPSSAMAFYHGVRPSAKARAIRGVDAAMQERGLSG